ncbi:MAG: dihydroneopterin aldolase [Thermoanaerobaculia bacterium]
MSERGDVILVRNLRLRGIVGINDWERETEQEIVIQLTLRRDLRAAARSDDIHDTVNYRTLTKDVIAYVESSRHYLVEALATAVARICCVDHGVESAVVRVEKPGALRFADSVGVEIERTPADFQES